MKTTASAHIALNRNRLRSYEKSVYLKDGSNFEIELFNGETVNVLAKIWINGNLISNSGLILKPGQRFYLDRFIDTNNKFLFETYKVDASIETASAIANNGLIKVEFFREQQLTVPKWSTGLDWTYRPTYTYGITNPYIAVTHPDSNNILFSTSNTYNGPLIGTVTVSESNGTITTSNLNNTSTETGRVEKGESSEQAFGLCDMNFDFLCFLKSEWKILPESSKPVEVSKIRNYCSECGTRIKKQTWKFCPSCGEKLD
jgi:hypothetical protein